MTVLPNAPIDAATGLPVPTIAVACGTQGQAGGGTSVIKDDGTVVDLTASTGAGGYASYSVAFTLDNTLITSQAYGGAYSEYHLHPSIPSSDQSISHNAIRYRTDQTSGISVDGTQVAGANYAVNKGIEGITDGFALAFNNATSRLTQVLRDDGANPVNENTIEGGAVNYITSTYNTGWMNGDIKLATLSNTDDTDVTGSELVTNGTFDSDVSGWSDASTGTGSIAYDNGTLKLIGADYPSNVGEATQTISVVSGKTYTVTFEVTSARGVFHQATGAWSKSANYTTGIHSYTVTAATNSVVLRFEPIGGSVSDFGNVDNVSVRLAEEDRSVNGKGLQVFGSITKNPIATGADLVAYSGFSASNYLEQPYNSDLDFGTGDFCYMGWVKRSATLVSVLFHRGTSVNNSETVVYSDASGNLVIRLRSNNDQLSINGIIPASQWTHVSVLRQGGILKAYVNGKLIGSRSETSSVDYTAPLTFGVWPTNNFYFGANLALWRISATATTAEQIAKIYEDEKVLFQENAQATLYGSSDAVTALAYDDSTELLHVGTSAGRSVFQGLRRVDNTTDAVGAAISASNGLVAED